MTLRLSRTPPAFRGSYRPASCLGAAALLVSAACAGGPAREGVSVLDSPTTDGTLTRVEAAFEPGWTIQPALSASPSPDDTAGVTAKPAEGLELSLWAALPGSPVALDFDHRGRAYVTQTTRRRSSDFNILDHREWLTEDLSLASVEEHRAFLHRVLDPSRSNDNAWVEDRNGDGVHDWRDLAVDRDRVLRVVDGDEDGRADSVNVFAEAPATEISGTAAGVLAHPGGDVWLGLEPDLWRFRDVDGDGRADERRRISHGYGVHIGLSGHGLSGLTLGPDGKIYWKVGDIGLNVVGPDGQRWASPNAGAVMRANPDGSDFEVFARGLRNVHEMAFDQSGNLIGEDNDSADPDDEDRIVYLVDGSDSGWRNHYWYSEPETGYNVWMREGLTFPVDDPRAAEQPAYITPPVAQHGPGAAGFAYNPGTALDASLRNHFFVALFTGSPATSRVDAFRLEPDGASFRLVEKRPVLEGILATGLTFGPDGALYAADWVSGWVVRDRGRIWKLDAPAAAGSLPRSRTRELLARDIGSDPAEAVAALLRHPDMRVRMKGQFELVRRGEAAWLLRATGEAEDRLARLHGIWGMGQLGRESARAIEPVVELLRDPDAEVRAQVAKVIGEAGYRPALNDLISSLADPNSRVRFFAAQSLGRLGDPRAVAALVRMLEANDDSDAYLRHAGSLALARIGDVEALSRLASHRSRAVRIAAVVALRRMGNPQVALFLRDEDAQVVAEAARAIHDDRSIGAAMPALAALLEQPGLEGEALLRRAINANLRVGDAPSAQRLAAYAARAAAPEEMRAKALTTLAEWSEPSVLDRVEGNYRRLDPHDVGPARAAFASVATEVLAASSARVRAAAAEAAGSVGHTPAAPRLFALLSDPREPTAVRLAALDALAEMGGDPLAEAIRLALRDPDDTVRTRAYHLISQLDIPGDVAAEVLATVVETGPVEEQQAALAVLGTLRSPRARAVIADWMSRLAAGDVAPPIQLDVLQAAEASEAPELRALVERYRAARPKDDPVAAYREALMGGDATAGRRVFFSHPVAECAVCHEAENRGGEVGPDLSNIAAQISREEILRALVDPSARIAPGYGLATAPSAMPPMGALLTPAEIRDVVAYIATLR